MPYFALVVVFARKYDKNAGVGTIAAMMCRTRSPPS